MSQGAQAVGTGFWMEQYLRDEGSVPNRVNGFNEDTLGADLDLKARDPVHQLLDPGGSNRDVNLPKAREQIRGRTFMVRHTGGSDDLVVKDQDGTTIVTVNAGDWAVVGVDFDGSEYTWKLLYEQG